MAGNHNSGRKPKYVTVDLFSALTHRLYGENWDKGDIPEMKEMLKSVGNNKTNIRVNRVLAVVAIMLSSGAVGLSKVIGLW